MNFLRYYIYYIFLHLTLAGSSFIQVGDAISVTLDSSVSHKRSSNILKSENGELSDIIYSYKPGAVVYFGKPGTVLDLKLSTYYDIKDYKEFEDLDISLLKVFLKGSFSPSDLINNSFSYSNTEGRTARSETDTPGSSALIETSNETASFLSQIQYSPKLSLSLGINYSDLTYDTDPHLFAAKRSVTLPFQLIYHYSDKLSTVYGIYVTDTDIGERVEFGQEAYKTKSTFYNVGLMGSILPKLTGQFNVGYRSLNYSDNMIGMNGMNATGVTSNLTWTQTPKLRSILDFSRDFDAAGSGSTFKFTRVNLSTVYSINTDYKMTLRLGRTAKNFRGNPNISGGDNSREERLRSLSLNLHYLPSENFSFVAAYNISRSRSELAEDYDLNVFSLTANLKY